MWNFLHPDDPCKGMIANCIVRHRKLTKDSFYSVLVPTPSEEQVLSLRTFLEKASALAGTDMANWAACYNFKPCYHYMNGACQRV